MPLSLLLSIVAQAAAPAPAAPTVHEPVCIRAGDLPNAFARWNDAAVAMPNVGAPFIVTAREAAMVRWVARPAKPGAGAVVRVQVARAGLYSIGLSNGAYVDIIKGKSPVKSIAHGHGPACTGLRKTVDFRLSRGPYTLQLAGMPEATTKLMIVAK